MKVNTSSTTRTLKSIMKDLHYYQSLLTGFIKEKHFLYIYPTIFIVGVFLNEVFPSRLFNYAKDNWWIVSSDNYFNKTFAYKGNHIFAILFTGVFFINLIHEFKAHNDTNDSSEPQEDALVQLSWKKFKHFTIKFTLKITILFILFYIIDHIFILTGGSCVIDKAVANILAKSSKSLEQCTEYNGTWVRLDHGFCSITPAQLSRRIKSAQICYKYGEWEGGFDISGHFCFITTLSLILWYELKEFDETYFALTDIEEQKKIEIHESSWFSFTVTNLVRWSVLISLIIWIQLLTTTAIFYHTVLEKLLGLALGYVGPYLFYHLIPSIKPLHEFLY